MYISYINVNVVYNILKYVLYISTGKPSRSVGSTPFAISSEPLYFHPNVDLWLSGAVNLGHRLLWEKFIYVRDDSGD